MTGLSIVIAVGLIKLFAIYIVVRMAIRAESVRSGHRDEGFSIDR